jgi:hypothetical protein
MSVYHIFCTQGYANSLQTYIGKSCSYNLDKLDIFPLMCVADKVWIIDPILINKNIRSVCNSHAQKLTHQSSFVKCIVYSKKKNNSSTLQITSFP